MKYAYFTATLIIVAYLIYKMEQASDALENVVDKSKRAIVSSSLYTEDVLKDWVDNPDSVFLGVTGFLQDQNEGHERSEMVSSWFYQMRKMWGFSK